MTSASGLHFEVKSPDVKYTADYINARYTYSTTRVLKTGKGMVLAPQSTGYQFRTERNVGRVGVMFVGWGGNNGTTVTAGLHANAEKVSWFTKDGKQDPNYWGSLTQSSVTRIGSTEDGEEIYIPMSDVLPTVKPNDLVVGGWDISSMNLKDGMERAGVLEYDLQRRIADHMETLKPLPSIYYPDFIASNQSDRADNVVEGTKACKEHVEHIRNDIRKFKEDNDLDKVIVLWTANTERFCDVTKGVHDTEENLMKAIAEGHSEVSPSQVFAVAALLEGCSYINGSPQNTLVPGIIKLAQRLKLFVGGDDFKSGQTKIKSVLVDFLISAGIKVESIVSYNHLGNNDGKNLNEPKQFRSKEISKSNVVDDMVDSNDVLYKPNEKPDHCVVIKYVPFVKDSKRAMDEYTSSIFLGGRNTIVMHNTCEDSLLAAPLIIDLVVLTELLERISYKTENMRSFERMESVMSVLSYLLKAPMVSEGPVINALAKQRSCIENIMRACVGLPPENDMLLEFKTPSAAKQPISA